MTRLIKVQFSDACSDILVWLAAQTDNVFWTWHGIRDAVAPQGAEDVSKTVINALRTLSECELIERTYVMETHGWRITDAGRKALVESSA